MRASMEYVDRSVPRLVAVRMLDTGVAGPMSGRDYAARLPEGSKLRIIDLLTNGATTQRVASCRKDSYEVIARASVGGAFYAPPLCALAGRIGVARRQRLGWGLGRPGSGAPNLPLFGGEDFRVTIGTYNAPNVLTATAGLDVWALGIEDPALTPGSKHDWEGYPRLVYVAAPGAAIGQRTTESRAEGVDGYSTRVLRMYADEVQTANGAALLERVRIQGYGSARLRDGWADDRMQVSSLATAERDDADPGFGGWLTIPDKGGVSLDIETAANIEFGMSFMGQLVR